ncbi:BMP/retinoic acid-inducible neural-specific protein 3 [Collichthys lucidus]|uniref:BMP/retinoic acid-inducible neural-specific protein 3 n=1 Tax=Collichthys lucidus TaxID=240159 RepID=A0A4U5UK37_COLLU|nr:BMP/retinoic acid-inducible neural-specific protein 3 [Collichthys lucidus]
MTTNHMISVNYLQLQLLIQPQYLNRDSEIDLLLSQHTDQNPDSEPDRFKLLPVHGDGQIAAYDSPGLISGPCSSCSSSPPRYTALPRAQRGVRLTGFTADTADNCDHTRSQNNHRHIYGRSSADKVTTQSFSIGFLPVKAEFGRWKVNSLALERQENNGFSLPLDPEFLQTIRQLGRRPSLGAITDNIIRKYGTHFLLSATLGGEESLMIFVDKRKLSRTSEVTEANGTAVTLEALHQLAASYFIDRESTLHKLHHIQIASTAIKMRVITHAVAAGLCHSNVNTPRFGASHPCRFPAWYNPPYQRKLVIRAASAARSDSGCFDQLGSVLLRLCLSVVRN